MKRLFSFFIAYLILMIISTAQAPPEAFNYSAVARDPQGNPLANTTIGIQISILKTSPAGPAQYTENHVVETDQFGLFNLIIGAGDVQYGSISLIVWSDDNYYLEVGMDVTGGTNFLLMGTTQLLSVPYSMHAKTAETLISNSPIFSLDFPEGINGAFVHFELSPSQSSYTVPNGYNLYITSASYCYPMVNGVLYGLDGSGPVFPENTTLNYVTSGWGACSFSTGFTGILIPKTNKIIPVYFKLDDLGSSYTVPSGKKLVLKSGTGHGSPICVNSAEYQNISGIWLFGPNATISNCNASSITPEGFGYTGYLIDN